MSSDLNITPLILTYNEEANIDRTLDSLRWAKSVVVLDSGSTDKTEQIARGYSNVVWCARAFDSHKAQWEYGVHQTGITTEYVLALDADQSVPYEFVEELREQFMPGQWVGGMTPFKYSYYGHPLSGSVYPKQIRVFKRNALQVTQPGHTQVFSVEGAVYNFRACLIHDDRKPLDRWVASQVAYQALNEKEMLEGGSLKCRLRRMGLMPPIMATLAYIRAGGPFRGAAAARYAYERAVAESLLAIRLLNVRLNSNGSSAKEESARK